MFRKENHVELSAGGTEIVSSKICPLVGAEINFERQVFHGAVCCSVSGQHGYFGDRSYMCSNYLGVVCTDAGIEIDCALRHKA